MPRPRRVGVRALRAAVRRWAVRLRLHDWTIITAVKALKGETVAECHARPEYREAELTFNLDRLAPEDLEATVAHEVLHCWTWGLWSAADAAARSEAQRELLRREHEALVTHLTHIALSARWP